MNQSIEAISRTIVPCKPYRACLYSLVSGTSEPCNVSEFVVAVYDAENYKKAQEFGVSGTEVTAGQFVAVQPIFVPIGCDLA